MGTKYTHINLVAKDWKKLSKFYIDVFNCIPKPPERDISGDWLDRLTGINSAHIKGIHLLLPGFESGGPTLEIFQYNDTIQDDNKSINREGFAHIAFAVDDVEECLDKLKENGGTTVGDIVMGDIESVGKIHVVYGKDPEGNIIEIQKWEK
jgi:predicted enzyme related to lactoylglutathione lyase